MNAHVRWMVVRDMPEVLAIESEVFEEDAWSGEDFRKILRQRNCIGNVAENVGDDHDEIVGYMVYELISKNKLVVLNLVVAPEWRRNGIGRQMLMKLVERSTRSIVFEVSDRDLATHLFLRSCGFKATKVLRDFFDSGSDAYIFKFRKERASA